MVHRAFGKVKNKMTDLFQEADEIMRYQEDRTNSERCLGQIARREVNTDGLAILTKVTPPVY